MVRVRRSFAVEADVVHAGIARIRAEQDVPASFPDEVVAAARTARPAPVERVDRRDLPFVTVDPAGSTDLDQALVVEPHADGGHVVWYAIADVAAFVVPGDPIDVESWERGVTLYAPDGRAPLHPAPLSEGSASLLPGVDRPAVLWRLRLDPDGALVDVDVDRALVNSREQLSHDEAQRRIDAGDPLLAPLAEVGRRRIAQEQRRGGVHLAVPDQEVVAGGGTYRLAYRTPLPVEEWNAQLSLLCGMAAADLMLGADRGLLRTLPPPEPDDLDELRRVAAALGVDWPDGASYPDVIRAVEPTTAARSAFVHQCTRLFRGAGYQPLGRDHDAAGGLVHAAIAAPYAHVTAPLRRLGDRYATEAVLSVVRGDEPPPWVNEALDALPAVLVAAGQRASSLDRATVDLVESLVLADRVGAVLTGWVVRRRRERAVVQVVDPAVVVQVETDAAVGSQLDVVVEAADPVARSVTVRPA